MDSIVRLRPYGKKDEDATIELWLRAWQAAMPHRDFASRLPWWIERWRNELVPKNRILLAEISDVLAGFVVIDRESGYLDQLVVAPECWGSSVAALLMSEAKWLSPQGIELIVNSDNLRAVHFYERQGFVRCGDEIPNEGHPPSWRMRWVPNFS